VRTSIQVWRKPPAFPAQWLYGLYEIVLVTLLFVTPSLSGSVGRLRTWRLHRGVGPKRFHRTLQPVRLARCRVHRSLSLVCDDGQRPSGGTGWRELCIWFARRGQRFIFVRRSGQTF